MNSALSYFFRRTKIGRDTLDNHLHEVRQDILDFKKSFTTSPEGQAMALYKLKELRQELQKINENINTLYYEQANGKDNEDFIYDIFIETWKRRLDKIKSSLWRFKMMLNGTKQKKYTPIDIDRIKEEIPISALLETGPQRKDFYREVYFCPFHSEQNPSFTIYKDQNSWFCFSCQTGGSVLDLYQKLHGCSIKESIKELNKLL